MTAPTPSNHAAGTPGSAPGGLVGGTPGGTPGGRRPAAPPRRGGRGEAGSTSYELVLLMPVLVLMVLFVLWAGRTGQARLAAELAAEEAATAAAVCCSAEEVDKREAVVGAVLAGRPELDFLCVNEPRPLDGYDRFVSDSALYFDGSGGSVNGVGVLGVGFECVTDGAVGVLGGVLGETAVRARAAAVVQLQPRAAATGVILPKLTVADVRTSEIFGEVTFTLVLDRAADEGFPVTVWWKTVDAANADPEYNATSSTRQDFVLREHLPGHLPGSRFDFCANQIYDEMHRDGIQDKDDFDPAKSIYNAAHRDYLRVAPSRVVFGPGETTRTLTVDIADDCLYERDEQFGIELENTSNVILSDSGALATILNDDDRPRLGFLNDRETADEDAGDFTVVLVLRNDYGQRIVSGVAVSGKVTTADGSAKSTAVPAPPADAICPADFDALTPSSGSFQLARSAGRTSTTVAILDDEIDEAAEEFTITLDSFTEAQQGTPSSATITIDDDDDPPYLYLVEPDDGTADRIYEITEPAADKEFELAVEIRDANGDTIGSGLDIAFNYRVAGSGNPPATEGSDFDWTPPTDPFEVAACGSPSPTDTPEFKILADTCREASEEFTVQLSPQGSTVRTNTESSLTVRILDDGDTSLPPC